MSQELTTHVDLDTPSDWRKAEFTLMVEDMRDRLRHGQWPAWLSAQGEWTHIRLVIDGVPTGPAICWPHALFIAAWLVETR